MLPNMKEATCYYGDLLKFTPGCCVASVFAATEVALLH